MGKPLLMSFNNPQMTFEQMRTDSWVQGEVASPVHTGSEIPFDLE